MAIAEERFVIAIDFGTTYSGVAACYSSNPDDIEVIKSWPGSNGITSEKVPSEFTYEGEHRIASQDTTDLIRGIITPKKASASTIKDVRWGFQLKHGEDRIKCIKLFLDSAHLLPEFVQSADVAKKLHVNDRDVISAAADYLHKIHEHTLNILRLRFGQAFVATTPTHFVLTVPAIWSDTAKNATLEAACRAGLDGSVINMISEPEAAATYTLKAIRTNHLKVGDNIVVCDAGGGTVDLISYHIKQLEPLVVEESNTGTGGLCGSIFLNIGFEKLVRSKLGHAKFNTLKKQKPKCWQTALKNFEDYVKRSFCVEDIEEENVYSIPFPGLPDIETIDLVDGFLTITAADVQGIFDPIVEKIADLVEDQVSAAHSKGANVSAIVLVGGFGQSSYLHSQLNRRFNNDRPPPYPGTSSRQNVADSRADEGPIEIMQPIYAWTAIVRGALLRGFDGSMVASRRCRYHYGFKYGRFFDPQIHPIESRYRHPYTLKYMANSCMHWFVAKNQSIEPSAAQSYSLQICYEVDRIDRAFALASNDQLDDQTDLYACSETTAPVMHNSTLIKVCSLKTQLRAVPRHYFQLRTNEQRRRYYKIYCDLVMKIDSASIHFELVVDGRTYGSVSASYYH